MRAGRHDGIEIKSRPFPYWAEDRRWCVRGQLKVFVTQVLWHPYGRTQVTLIGGYVGIYRDDKGSRLGRDEEGFGPWTLFGFPRHRLPIQRQGGFIGLQRKDRKKTFIYNNQIRSILARSSK